MKWYYSAEGHSRGPVNEAQLVELARAGEVTTETLIWHPGLEEWEPVWKLKPGIVEQLNKKAMAQQAKGSTDRVPVGGRVITERVAAEVAAERAKAGASPGIFKRLFGKLTKKQS